MTTPTPEDEDREAAEFMERIRSHTRALDELYPPDPDDEEETP